MLNRERLYEAIDSDEDMSDSEKRESYFAEIAEDAAEQEWQDSH